MIIIHSDDILIMCKHKEETDKVIDHLNERYKLTQKGSIEQYLGVTYYYDTSKNTLRFNQ